MSIFGNVADALAPWFLEHDQDYRLFYSFFDQLRRGEIYHTNEREPDLFLRYLSQNNSQCLMQRLDFIEIAFLVPRLIPIDSWVLECLWNETNMLLMDPAADKQMHMSEWIVKGQTMVHFPGIGKIKSKYPAHVIAQLNPFNQIGVSDKILDITIPSYDDCTQVNH